jgi:hypothetical protein
MQVHTTDLAAEQKKNASGVSQHFGPTSNRDVTALVASAPPGSSAQNSGQSMGFFQFYSEPTNAEIEIDGSLRPSLAHTIKISKRGFVSWEYNVSVQPGDSRNVTAELDR